MDENDVGNHSERLPSINNRDNHSWIDVFQSFLDSNYTCNSNNNNQTSVFPSIAKTYQTVEQTITLPPVGIQIVSKIYDVGTPKTPQITLVDVWRAPGDIKEAKVSKVIPK